MKNIWYLRKYIYIQQNLFVFNKKIYTFNEKYLIFKENVFAKYICKIHLHSFHNSHTHRKIFLFDIFIFMFIKKLASYFK